MSVRLVAAVVGRRGRLTVRSVGRSIGLVLVGRLEPAHAHFGKGFPGGNGRGFRRGSGGVRGFPGFPPIDAAHGIMQKHEKVFRIMAMVCVCSAGGAGPYIILKRESLHWPEKSL